MPKKMYHNTEREVCICVYICVHMHISRITMLIGYGSLSKATRRGMLIFIGYADIEFVGAHRAT